MKPDGLNYAEYNQYNYTNLSMKPKRGRPARAWLHQQASNAPSASTEHFHYESASDTSSAHSRPASQSQAPSAPHPDHAHLTQSFEDLKSIHENSHEEEEAVLSPPDPDNSSREERSSEFTFHSPKAFAATAQKSRFSRHHDSAETSSEEENEDRLEEGRLDDTFSYDISKLCRDHQFQFCETPKPPKESKQTDTRPDDKPKSQTLREQDPRMTFVKYDQSEVDEEGRRYPYRASRAAPRLKYWEGERTDPVHQGYWKRKN